MLFLLNSEKTDALEHMKGFKHDEFAKYLEAYGWQDWMNKYTSMSGIKGGSESERKALFSTLEAIWNNRWQYGQMVGYNYDTKTKIVQDPKDDTCYALTSTGWNGDFWFASECDPQSGIALENGKKVHIYTQTFTHDSGFTYEDQGYRIVYE